MIFDGSSYQGSPELLSMLSNWVKLHWIFTTKFEKLNKSLYLKYIQPDINNIYSRFNIWSTFLLLAPYTTLVQCTVLMKGVKYLLAVHLFEEWLEGKLTSVAEMSGAVHWTLEEPAGYGRRKYRWWYYFGGMGECTRCQCGKLFQKNQRLETIGGNFTLRKKI